MMQLMEQASSNKVVISVTFINSINICCNHCTPHSEG